MGRTSWSTAGGAALVSLLLLGSGAGPAAAGGKGRDGHKGEGPVVAAYFASWDVYGRGYQVKDIPVDKLNTILYAFGKPELAADRTPTGGCAPADPWADYQSPYVGDVDPSKDRANLNGNFEQLLELKAMNPHLKVLISVGGWSLSEGFSQNAATPQSRATFAKSCIDMFIRGNLPPDWVVGDGVGVAAGVFDGIDIDWEYPTAPGAGNTHSPADRHNATLLFQEFRNQLRRVEKETGKDFQLTAAIPAGDASTRYYELKQVSRVLDNIFVMTYDFHGHWESTTDFNSPFTYDPATPNPDPKGLFATKPTIEHYLKAGVAPNKITVGVPFYGKQYIRAGTANNGLYQPYDNTGMDGNVLQWDLTPFPTYHDLVDVAGVLNADGSLSAGGASSGWSTHWSTAAGEPWLYNPAATHPVAGAETSPTFISHESPTSIAERTALVQQYGLRGAFAWEVSQDSTNGDLLDALAPLLP
jgi:chitinase